MIDHVSGLDWKKNFRSLDCKQKLRSKKRYFHEITPPNILCASPFKKIALFVTCDTIFMRTAYPTYQARAVCVRT